jgi:hypothetical protein
MTQFESAGLALPAWGRSLTEADYLALEQSWISRELADASMLRRVDTHEGRQAVGQPRTRDCSGILIPYYWPGETYAFSYRLRRDNPEWTANKEGKAKQKGKYLGPPRSGNRLYIPVGVTPEQLQDPTIRKVIVEGEKKAIALWRLANHNSARPRCIPIGLSGVWNWRGTVAKAPNAKGERIDVKGPIADLSRIQWKNCEVFIVFDANVATNDSVKWARKGIARLLSTRGAEVKLINLPAEAGVNGVDDLLALWGPERVLELFGQAVRSMQRTVVRSPQYHAKAEGLFRIV